MLRVDWLRWLILGGMAITVIVVPFPASASTPTEHIFHIEASRFEYSPAVLAVNPGDRVTIDLTATDVVHGLYIDDYGLNITADPGQTVRLACVSANRRRLYPLLWVWPRRSILRSPTATGK